ncbi:MAG: hypothetical protein RLZZ196_3479 [Bacteroidota bacterium]|jgi:hypothetical protein
MGFNHCYLSSIENLQNELNNKGLENFIKSYRKYDALTGPSECFRFLEQKIEEYELQQIQVVDKGENEQTT